MRAEISAQMKMAMIISSERLPEFLRVDRVNSEIKTHPEAFGMAEEEERQNKG